MLAPTVSRSDVPSRPIPPARAARLSWRLREETAAAHAAVERVAGLPDGVTCRETYRAALAAFARAIVPLERAIAQEPGLAAYGIDAAARARAPALLTDLARLGAQPPAAGAEVGLRGTGAVLGALYVIEGSTLGGALVLRAIEERIGRDIADARAFLGGRGAEAGALWGAFRAALDRFGEERPDEQADAVAGATTAFDLFIAAFEAERARSVPS